MRHSRLLNDEISCAGDYTAEVGNDNRSGHRSLRHGSRNKIVIEHLERSFHAIKRNCAGPQELIPAESYLRERFSGRRRERGNNGLGRGKPGIDLEDGSKG